MEQDIKNLQLRLDQQVEALLPKTSTSCVKIGQGSTRTVHVSHTERSGIAIAEDPQVQYLKNQINDLIVMYENIKDVRNMLDEDELQYVILRYDKEKSHNETQAALQIDGICMSERNYYRFRQNVIYKIARYLGYCG